MTQDQEPTPAAAGLTPPDPALIIRGVAGIAQRSQALVNDWLRRQAQEGMPLDPLNVGGAFLEMTTKLMANPAALIEAQSGVLPQRHVIAPPACA
jgi:polyhydroxyalkanoate synthase